MSESYLVIELNHQPVELCKLLKIANLVSGGGEAKVVISEGYVLLNGNVEYQKRKKVYHEDVIEFNGEVVQLHVNEELVATKEVTDKTSEKSERVTPTQEKNKIKNTSKNSAKSDEIATDNLIKVPKKRRPILF